MDFEHQRREEVIQYLYSKYGRDRAALAAAVSTYRPRGALRESGKALGVDPAIVDMVAKAHHWFDSKADLLKRFEESGVDTESELTQRWASMATQLLGFPRHLSQHSGGFVIARGKLSRLVPIENAAMPDRSVIQWDSVIKRSSVIQCGNANRFDYASQSNSAIQGNSNVQSVSEKPTASFSRLNWLHERSQHSNRRATCS